MTYEPNAHPRFSANDPTRAAAELCRRYAADPEQSSTHLLANGGHCTVGLMAALLESRRRLEEALERHRAECEPRREAGLEAHPCELCAALAWPGSEEEGRDGS